MAVTEVYAPLNIFRTELMAQNERADMRHIAMLAASALQRYVYCSSHGLYSRI
ncbi:Hypothetical protein ETEE_3262 [Edwardsiella anguillarum ET080813]|uniref:Uncharacterized protein n=1 Tax=Edwardsiella anguillarum ET080813 TaxID=667120 RepID=A0A076LP79_9GAMM|nr:Hypothetical protein ETEE_3262 [Edwardsiella anguillarum ET080813]